ncbi:MAG: hypothetical protein BRC26_03575 [Nanohaloarchaea archaeon QH_8_44_6]|nr:MAG: hypothetical protein BRC26_03575 [Nanohaloarchaea archaeon QH_8_44_6]
MGRIDKPWGYEKQVLVTQVDIGDRCGMLGMRKLFINIDEMTSYAVHSEQSDMIYLEKGQAVIRRDGEIEDLEEGAATIIRSGQKHQIQNNGTDVAEVLEISFPYKPEDIERIEDPYTRERKTGSQE